MSSFYTNIRPYGDSLLYIGYKDGQRIKQKIKFQPELFVQVDGKSDTEFKSYDGTALSCKRFSSMKECKSYLEQYKDIHNFPIYGTKEFPVQFISKFFPKEVEYDLNHLRIFNLDIETMADCGFITPKEATAKITAITIKDVKNDIFYTWGVKPFKPHLKNIVYKEFTPDTEKEMLADFIAFWQMNYPDVISGWHTRLYDIPYLHNRITKVLGESAAKKLSPWGIIWEKRTNTQKIKTREDQQEFDIYGISNLDYMDLYKKYSQGQEASYKLDHIAWINLGEKKLEYEGSLHQLYTNDYQRYIEYNIQDVALIEKLEAKLKYIELILEISYMGKVPQYTDSLGTTKYWETMIYHDLYAKKIISPIKKHEGHKDKQFRGAFVKEPVPGKYKWVVSYDLASLYPSLIRQLSIGPETIVEDIPDELRALASSLTVEKLINDEIDTSILKKYNYSMGANGAFFKHEKSFLSEMVGGIFDKRQKDKKKSLNLLEEYQKTHDESKKEESNIYDIKQYAGKILINSLYGGIGTQYFQYYNESSAEAVTLTGQYVIQKTEKELNQYLNKLNKTKDFDFSIAIDTDSIYLNLAPIVDKLFSDQSDTKKITDFLDKLCKEKIDPFIENLYKDIFNKLNCFENRLSMKREVISSVAVWKAKKRYAMYILDNEGVRFSEPKFKVKGLEVVSSKTPEVCQEKLADALKIILNGSENQLQDFIFGFRKEFSILPPESIAISQSVNGLEEYASLPKGTPHQVKASLAYNKLLKKHDIDKIYESIKSGNKMKHIPLKMPNIIQTDFIGFVDKLPKEFDLHRYINYDEQFDKVFIAPLKPIANIVGWDLEKRNTFDAFY